MNQNGNKRRKQQREEGVKGKYQEKERNTNKSNLDVGKRK